MAKIVVITLAPTGFPSYVSQINGLCRKFLYTDPIPAMERVFFIDVNGLIPRIRKH